MIDADQPSPVGADSPVRQRLRVGGGFRELGIVIALVLLCAFFWWRDPGVLTKPVCQPQTSNFGQS